jgi:hypothetical protein
MLCCLLPLLTLCCVCLLPLLTLCCVACGSFKMSRYCPFPDQAHVPPGPHVVGSRLALRRHMVLIHQADLQVCYDASCRQYDQVVRLSGDDLARKTDVFRRAQRHRVKVTAAPSVRGCTTSGLPASPSWVGPASSGEADFSSGQDDFSMWWEGDELPDLVNTASDSGAGALASAVAASVQLSGAQFASSTTPMQVRDTFQMLLSAFLLPQHGFRTAWHQWAADRQLTRNC